MFTFKDSFQTWNFTTPPPQIFKQPEQLQYKDTLENSFLKNFTNFDYLNFDGTFRGIQSEQVENKNDYGDTLGLDQKQIDRATEIGSKQYKATSNNKQYFTDKKEFVKTLDNAYKRALSKKGLSTKISLMLVAQDALETGYGKKVKGKYNFGNITTAGNDWTSRTGKLKWKDFKSIDDYAEYKINFLGNKRYRLFTDMPNINNVQQTMQILADRGYCPGSPSYGSKINQVYNSILRHYV